MTTIPDPAASLPPESAFAVDINPFLKQLGGRAKSAVVLWAKDHQEEVRAQRADPKNPGDYQHTAAMLFRQLPQHDQDRYHEKARLTKQKDHEETANQWEQYVVLPATNSESTNR